MRKTLLALFVVLAILASAVPVSAQGLGYVPQTWDGWYYKWQGNQAMMLTADNLGMVRNLSKQLRRTEFRSLRDDIRWNEGYGGYGAYGLYGPQGFYPMYDRDRQPLSRKVATIVGAGVGGGVGALIGYGVARNGQGSLVGAGIGAGVGALIGLATHRGNRNNKDVIVTPESEQSSSQQQNVRWGADGIPVTVGMRPAGMPTRLVEPPQPQLGWKIFRNRFESLEVRIHVVGENPSEYISVSAGEEFSRELPADAKIWAEVIVWKGSRQVPTQELGQRELPYHSGWVFFNPAKGEI